jgi:hypothetical protein
MYGDDGKGELEKLLDIGRKERQHERDTKALRRLSTDPPTKVRTPDGWTGMVVEKYPDKGKAYVETWENAGTYRAGRLEVVDE